MKRSHLVHLQTPGLSVLRTAITKVATFASSDEGYTQVLTVLMSQVSPTTQVIAIKCDADSRFLLLNRIIRLEYRSISYLTNHASGQHQSQTGDARKG